MKEDVVDDDDDGYSSTEAFVRLLFSTFISKACIHTIFCIESWIRAIEMVDFGSRQLFGDHSIPSFSYFHIRTHTCMHEI